MRKLLSLFLVLMFLTTMTYPAFASSHKETALDYLMKKYNVPKEKIELYEGGITELKFTSESFWLAKYIIFTGEKPSSGAIKGEKPQQIVPEPMPMPAPDSKRLPAAEPMPMPAPDMSADGRKDIAPLPPQGPAGGGDIYGGIYIRIKTGEVLEMEKVETFFIAENKLAQQEWERLRKEAGKIDVSLYQKILGLPAAEKVKVSIQPNPVETDNLKAQFEVLKKKYPEYTSGMELSNILPYGYGYAVPESRGGGVSSSGGSTGYAVPAVDAPLNYVASAADAAVSYVVPDNQGKSTPTSTKQNAVDLPLVINEKSRQEYSAMWGELDKIRQQAVMPSLSDIKKALDSKGAAYKEIGNSISAELTTAQIQEVAKLSSVSAVFEEATYTTMDAAMGARDDLSVRSSAPSAAKAVSMEVGNAENPSSNLYIIVITLILLAAAIIIYRYRIIRTVKK